MTLNLVARARLAFAFVVLSCLVMGTFALNDASAANKKLRIGYTAIPTNIPIILAQEQGIYKKNGLDVKLTPLQCSGCSLPALGKQYDIMTSTVVDFLQVKAKGLDPIIIAGGNIDTKAAKPQPNLVTKRGINSYKELKGKTIGSVAVGTGTQYGSLLIALKKAGMKKTDVKVVQVPFPNMLSQLQAGRIDAALAVEPFLTLMKRAGFGGFANTLLAASNPAIGATWAAKASAVRKDKAKYAAFYKSISQAAAFAQKNKSVAVDSIVKNLKQTQANASLTDFAVLKPKLQNKWVTSWIKPLEGVGLLKKGKLSTKTNYVFKP